MIEKKRLLTRCDFDGVVCAALLKKVGIVEEVRFVHPKDMQDGRVSISESDVTANLPYVDNVYIAFDHHSSEEMRLDIPPNYVTYPNASSASRVIYEYYGGKERFGEVFESVMIAIDRADTASYTMDQIMNPEGWTLLAFVLDPRTGLGRFRNFRLKTHDMMVHLADLMVELSNDPSNKDDMIGKILADADIKERVDLYNEHHDKFVEQLKRCTKIHKNMALIDYRNEETIYSGNRFIVYAVFPEINISVHEIWGKNKRNVVFAAGRSIFNKTSTMDIGAFMLKFGGGGHASAGTCQVKEEEAEKVRSEIIIAMTQDV
ncbi:MAG: exopolyphosphatase [Alphaproteobacteria bacterium]|nr:exopolyphosphatase [Alphaproteobacteria bacterium]